MYVRYAELYFRANAAPFCTCQLCAAALLPRSDRAGSCLCFAVSRAKGFSPEAAAGVRGRRLRQPARQ